ncbi:MAG: glycoside hydrolase family 15 protein [Thermoplasmata archaeon]|nr:glycoside hydrolase family 15 protein [Thermoplasmata archaeon]MCI4358829.1 glycoside hydrolase family 15 protein [Thermoplasmata archaeon]
MITQLAGNGRILLTLNDSGEWENLFYPYPGQFQHLREARLGFWDETRSRFQWLRPGNGLAYLGPIPGSDSYPSTLWKGDGLTLTTEEIVHPNHNLVVRVVRMESEQERRLRLFSYQSFMITESMYQETAYLDPTSWSLVHYKRGYYFELFGDPAFDRAVCGEHTLKGLKGSYVDAEDGRLEGRTIAHGAADSVLQWDVHLAPKVESAVRIVLAIDRGPAAVHRLRDEVRAGGLARYESESKAFWDAWVPRHLGSRVSGFGEPIRRLVRSSVLVLKHCSGTNGSIIASPDSRSLAIGGDSYNYCWWRDGGYVSMAMDDSGMGEYADRFLHFALQCQSPDGAFVHRHFPDGEIGSTWHPPPFVQVDQTASVVAAAWHHLERGADPDTFLELWPMVKRAANFLTDFRDEATGLSAASFDLWEERFGVHAYSSAAVAHALEGAARIAETLGKDYPRWRIASQEIRRGVLEHLWDPKLGRFIRSLAPRDERIDASLLLALDLNLLPHDDPRFRSTVDAVTERLWSKEVGGLARYEDDGYYGHENPWIVCTLWLSAAHLRMGNRTRGRELIDWVVQHTPASGLLPEQVDARTGEPKSATPLTWSHAAFLELVYRYRETMSVP